MWRQMFTLFLKTTCPSTWSLPCRMSTHFWILIVYNLFQGEFEMFCPKAAWLKLFVKDNHYKTIYGPIGNEYSSCRVLWYDFKMINDVVFSYIGRHNNCHVDENWSHNFRPMGAIQKRMRTKIEQRVRGCFVLHSPNIPFVLFPSDHWYEELTSYCPISSDWEPLCSNRSTIALGYGTGCFPGSKLSKYKYQ